jgi:hypothetical protein
MPGLLPGMARGKLFYMKPVTASQTSAVFVTDGTFEEPMEYPQGANICPVLASPPS